MKKKLIALTAAAACVVSMLPAVFAEVNPAVIVNDREIVFPDQKAVILEDEGRTVIPARGVFEFMGARVNWNDAEKKVTIKKSGTEIMLTIGSEIMTVYTYSAQNLLAPPSKNEVTLDAPARIMNDRTMIPLRAIAESLDADVQWNDEEKSVYIYTSDYTAAVTAPTETTAPDATPAPGETTAPDATPAPGETAAPDATPVPGGPAGSSHVSTTIPTTPTSKNTSVSLSANTTKANPGDEIEVKLNVNNIPQGYFVNGFSLGLVYDHSKLEYVGNSTMLVNDNIANYIYGENPKFASDALKLSCLSMLENSTLTADNGLATLKFKVLSAEPSSIKISNRYTPGKGYDTLLFLINSNGDEIKLKQDLVIDTTPISIN